MHAAREATFRLLHDTHRHDRTARSPTLIGDNIVSIDEYRIKVIDPSGRQPVTLLGAGRDESTIVKSAKKLRIVAARHTGAGKTR